MIDACMLHHGLQSTVPAGVFGVGKTRVFLRDDRAQARGELEHQLSLARRRRDVVIDDQPPSAAVLVGEAVPSGRRGGSAVAHLEIRQAAAVDLGIAETPDASLTQGSALRRTPNDFLVVVRDGCRAYPRARFAGVRQHGIAIVKRAEARGIAAVERLDPGSRRGADWVLG